MRIIILIQVIFLGYSLKAQEGGGFVMNGNNIAQAELEKRILKLDKVQTANLDSVKLGLHYMDKANLYLYSGRDSAFIFLQRALELNRKNICGVLWAVKRYQNREGNNKWFIPDLNVPNIDSFMVSKCGQKWIEPIGLSNIEKPNTYKSDIAKRIMLNDQMYRVNKEVDWQKQNRLDSLNQIFVDSLYLAKGTLNGFNREETDAISFVIHHSNDCYWVLKWLDIWLSEYHIGKFDGAGMVIGPAFNRMLLDEKAYCKDQLPDLSKVFLERIKKEFPKEVGIRFGYIKEE
jgi:hypothetical protein